MPQLKRGMKPFRPEAVPLKFSNYLIRPKLPVLPKKFGHVTREQPPVHGGWGMCGNDRAGDCVCAGGEHEHMLWAWATSRPIPTFNTTSLQNYSDMLVAEGQQPYDPDNPDTDTGLDPASAAQWRQTVGLIDDAGVRHKIGPFVQLDSLQEIEFAGYLFGAAGLCWQLPASAEDQFSSGNIWDDLSGQPGGGHYTVYAGRNSRGVNFCVTWGVLQGFSDDYAKKYMFGSIGMLSKEYMLDTGHSPEGIAWDELAADQQQIASL